MTTDEERASIREALRRTTCVLFDFDGPVCRLFAGHPASAAADHLKRYLAARALLPDRLAASNDPVEFLRRFTALHRQQGDAAAATSAVARLLVEQEVLAAGKAGPTAHAQRLIKALVAGGRRIAITSNNSAEAVSAYLDARGLSEAFGEHIYGRPEDPSLMKPNPHCVTQAVEAFDVPAGSCLMIGDSATDVEAAGKAGTEFLGYARNQTKADILREAGASLIVRTLRPVAELAEAIAAGVGISAGTAPSSVLGR